MANKRGIIRIGEVPSVVLILVTLGIFLAVGALIIQEIQDTPTIGTDNPNGFAFNATDQALQGLATLASFQTIIAVVVAAAVILGVVFLIRT